MLKEIVEGFSNRRKDLQVSVSKYNLVKGNKVSIKGKRGIITQVRTDMIRIDYDDGGFDGFYFDELEKNNYKVVK